MLNMEKGSPGIKELFSSEKLETLLTIMSQIFNFIVHLINGPSNSSKLEKSLAITAAEESLTNTKQSRNA